MSLPFAMGSAAALAVFGICALVGLDLCFALIFRLVRLFASILAAHGFDLQNIFAA